MQKLIEKIVYYCATVSKFQVTFMQVFCKYSRSVGASKKIRGTMYDYGIQYMQL